MTPAKKRGLWGVGAPLVVCIGAAALLGGLLRPPSPPAPTVVEDPKTAALAPSQNTASDSPAPNVPSGVGRPEEIADDKPVAPLPPLPEGTTVTDLTNGFIDQVCACKDMECVKEARSRYRRYYGQALASPVPLDRREANRRTQECLQAIRDADGDDEQGG
ncbi:MAG: hypothetical protein U0441_10365 [Polyangiaceae bacterium]